MLYYFAFCLDVLQYYICLHHLTSSKFSLVQVQLFLISFHRECKIYFFFEFFTPQSWSQCGFFGLREHIGPQELFLYASTSSLHMITINNDVLKKNWDRPKKPIVILFGSKVNPIHGFSKSDSNCGDIISSYQKLPSKVFQFVLRILTNLCFFQNSKDTKLV